MKNLNKTVVINTRGTPRLKRDFERHANSKGMRSSELLRKLIEKELRTHKKKRAG